MRPFLRTCVCSCKLWSSYLMYRFLFLNSRHLSLNYLPLWNYTPFTTLFSTPEPKAHMRAYSIPMLRRPASVRRCPSASTISNISETAFPTKTKFYVKPPWVGGTKICLRHLGHMTKMVAMPIYGKNPSKIFFSGTGNGRRISTKLGM